MIRHLGQFRTDTFEPKVPAPESLSQMRKSLEQYSRTDPLEPLHDLAHVLVGPIRQKYVHVVSRYFPRYDVDFVLRGNLSDQIPEPVLPLSEISARTQFTVHLA
jgi:hypothetical protein